ncbi:MAG: GNAT family N-acetyltransferase [Alphaproteobacteria bacterium]|nr:GNAT family N-acetyltransferase [Alphaproteobacteria bacterium]
MAEFPKRIDCGDCELVKPEVTFSKSQEFFDVIVKNKEFLLEWLDWPNYYSKPEDAYNYLKTVENVKGSSYLIQVDGKIVGGHGFVNFNEEYKFAELGYWLAPDFNGRGLVVRGIAALENLAFGQFGLNRLQIKVDTENVKSQAVAVRAGYVKEGILRHGYVLHGAPRDVIVYSKLKSEWEKGKVK